MKDEKNDIKGNYGMRGFGIFVITLVCFIPGYIINASKDSISKIDNAIILIGTLIDLSLKSLQISFPIVLVAFMIALILSKQKLQVKINKSEGVYNPKIKKFIRNTITIINCIYLFVFISVNSFLKYDAITRVNIEAVIILTIMVTYFFCKNDLILMENKKEDLRI